MARIVTVGIEAKTRIPKRAVDFKGRAPIREAIVNLQRDRVIEIVPEDGETLRGVQHNVARAIREI